jgi:uncharacterized membrane protein
MDAYTLVKWLHVLSATLLFGTGLGTAFHMWLAHRHGDVRAIAATTRSTVLADWLFTLLSGIAQPVTGLVLVYLLGYRLTESWLVATYALYALAGGCWLIVAKLQIDCAGLAREAAEAGLPLPSGYRWRMRLWFALGWPGFLSLLVVFWLMTAKPILW